MTVKNQQDKTWTFDNKCRWKITATLQTLSPLHIGNGEIIEKNFQGENQPTKANAIIRGKQNEPLIPGSSIKGKLRRYLKEGVDATYQNELNCILGKPNSNGEPKEGMGGACRIS